MKQQDGLVPQLRYLAEQCERLGDAEANRDRAAFSMWHEASDVIRDAARKVEAIVNGYVEHRLNAMRRP